jgi:hypothetical protein
MHRFFTSSKVLSLISEEEHGGLVLEHGHFAFSVTFN